MNRFKWPWLLIVCFLTSVTLILNQNETCAGTSRSGVEKLLKNAKLRMKRKDYSAVIDALNPISDRLPRSALLVLAQAYKERKLYLDEARTRQLIIQKNESDYRAHYQLAKAYSHSENSQEALKHFQKSIDINPRFLKGYAALADEFKANKNNYEARVVLLDIIKNFGPQAKFLNDICELFTMDNYIQEATEYCQKAISANPDHAPNHIYLAKSFFMASKDERAETILINAAKQFPKSTQAQLAAGNHRLKEKNFAAAMKYFARAVQVDAQLAEAQIGLAKSLFELNKFKPALTAYMAFCQLDRNGYSEVKKAAVLLRQHGQTLWHERYSKAANRCFASR